MRNPTPAILTTAAILFLGCFTGLRAHDGKECYVAKLTPDDQVQIVVKPCSPTPGSPAPKTADRAWWLVNSASWAISIADVENTQYVMRLGGREGNPIYGSHPSRLRAYAISGGIAGLTTYLSYRWKKQDDLDFIQYHKYYKIRWWSVDLVNVGAHGFGLAFTFAATGK
jgi:hypothetical protein